MGTIGVNCQHLMTFHPAMHAMAVPEYASVPGNSSSMHRDSEGRACICGYYEGQTFDSFWAVESALNTIFAACTRANTSKEIDLCNEITKSFYEERRRLYTLTWPRKPKAPDSPFCE